MCKQPLARLSNNKSNCSATGKKLAWTEQALDQMMLRYASVCCMARSWMRHDRCQFEVLHSVLPSAGTLPMLHCIASMAM